MYKQQQAYKGGGNNGCAHPWSSHSSNNISSNMNNTNYAMGGPILDVTATGRKSPYMPGGFSNNNNNNTPFSNQGVPGAGGYGSPPPSPFEGATRALLVEQYVTWLTSFGVEKQVVDLIQEYVAAAKRGTMPMSMMPQVGFGADGQDGRAAASNRSPSPPGSPPALTKGAGRMPGNEPIAAVAAPSSGTSPLSHLDGGANRAATPPGRFRVDEMDTRAPSPGSTAGGTDGFGGRVAVAPADVPMGPSAAAAATGGANSATTIAPSGPLAASYDTAITANFLSSGALLPGAVVNEHHHIPSHHNTNKTETSGASNGNKSPSLGSSGSNLAPTGLARSASNMSTSSMNNNSRNYSHLQTATYKDVPVFYRPREPAGQKEVVDQRELDILRSFFLPGNNNTPRNANATPDPSKRIARQQFSPISSGVFALPRWLSDLLFVRIARFNNIAYNDNTQITFSHIKKYYDSEMALSTRNRRLFDLIKGDANRTYLTLEDLKTAIKCLVENHPGLEFLRQPEFQEFYCRTVAIRIIYDLEERQGRKVTWSSFDRSELPDIMRDLDSTNDINQVLRYFSYEHFYVLYCRFWELDTDRDQHLSINDLISYSGGSVSEAALARVVAGAGRKLTSMIPERLDFEDFIYFCLSEEEKNSPAAVYYWFKVLDLDGDGVLSGYELEHFFSAQRARLTRFGLGEEVQYEDMLCQMIDMLGANRVEGGIEAMPNGTALLRDRAQTTSESLQTRLSRNKHGLAKCGLTLSDFKLCTTPGHFFNMLFNAPKFVCFEHRDPFGEHQLKQAPERTDWDRFARSEYDRMANEVQQQRGA